MEPSEDRKKKLRTLHKRFSRVRAIVAVVAGLVSVGGFLYSFLVPSLPRTTSGDLVAIVQDARSRQPVRDATVEILTEGDAVVTTLTSEAEGRARRSLKEGGYKLRITHPRFGPETRKVQVLAGQTAEVRVALSPRPAPSSSPGQAVSEGVGNVKKFFRELK